MLLEGARDREALVAPQLQCLREIVARIAAHNPDYHRHLGGVSPGDLACLSDLRALPFLTKEPLRDAYPYGMVCAGPRAGPPDPHVVGDDRLPDREPLHTVADIRQWREIMARSYRVAGVAAEDAMSMRASLGLVTSGFSRVG